MRRLALAAVLAASLPAFPAAAQETAAPSYEPSGQPTGCIRRSRVRSIRPLADGQLYFRMLVAGPDYVNNVRGQCEYKPKVEALVGSTPNSQNFCSGDTMNRVVLQDNLYRGHCVLGDFTPVKRGGGTQP